MKKVPKSLKIYSIVTSILILLIFITILILFFTILKPKQPKVTTQQVTLVNYNFVLPDPTFTLGLIINVYNPNYASFKYHETTSYVTYHDDVVAEAPIVADTIPARGSHDIRTDVLVSPGNLVLNPSFLGDFFAGTMNFTSSTTFNGKASVLKMFKIKATTYSTCDISVHVIPPNTSSVCTSKVKF